MPFQQGVKHFTTQPSLGGINKRSGFSDQKDKKHELKRNIDLKGT